MSLESTDLHTCHANKLPRKEDLNSLDGVHSHCLQCLDGVLIQREYVNCQKEGTSTLQGMESTQAGSNISSLNFKLASIQTCTFDFLAIKKNGIKSYKIPCNIIGNLISVIDNLAISLDPNQIWVASF